MKYLCFLLLTLGVNSAVHACNVPVFRYALERWRPDLCELIVFSGGTLTNEQEKSVRKLETESSANNGNANVTVIRSNIQSETDPIIRKLWSTLEQRPTTELPYVVVRTKLGHGRTINNWDGPLDAATQSILFDSAVRKELARRLVAGHSVVWLMVKSADAKRSLATRDLLKKQLAKLATTVELPEGVGLPGSQLQSDVPLLLKFSVLEIDPADPTEQFLVKLLTGFHPDSAAAGEPLLIPVFGRGRALEVIPASELDAALVQDLTLFLCGACLCQVKDQNPGFDLLISTNWAERVFGIDRTGPPSRSTTVRDKRPVTLAIPPGGRKK